MSGLDGGFEEMTGAELVVAIEQLRLTDEPVEITIEDHVGTIVFSGLTNFRVTVGTDYDRSGGYQWTQITARAERRVADRTMVGVTAETAPIGLLQPVWSSGGGVYRELTHRGERRTEEGNILLYFDHQPVPVVYPPRSTLHGFPPPDWHRGTTP